MTESIYLGFALTVLGIGVIVISRLYVKKKIGECHGILAKAREAINEASDFITSMELSLTSKAIVEERTGGTVPYFAVCRKAGSAAIDVLRIPYDPNDPDDREYKRTFAEEHAAMLNDKP